MNFFTDPTVFLSLAMLLYAGALWLFYTERRERAVLLLWAGAGLLHLTLQRYMSTLNSPSLHLFLASFWLVPGLSFVLGQAHAQANEAGAAFLQKWSLALSYAAIVL